ncbi:nuclear transport factor 2 family protein [uncultured Microbacterium sp.]|uniref:nuclear transport factor 2 family protein n=1 Tax=Microbacterium proteolyticum TaxID=1572644 RepID=UPI0030F760A9
MGSRGALSGRLPVADGEPVASVAYSVLRRDWANGTTTPVPSSSPDDRARVIAAAWAAEEQLLTPGVRGDSAALRRLLAEDFVEIGQSGRRWTRDDIIAALVSDPGRGGGELSEREARRLAPALVLLHYLLRLDGRNSRRTSIWRSEPEPRCVFHQGTPVP